MSPLEQLLALRAFVLKEVGRFARLWQQTLLPPIITTTLYFLIFGNVIGRRVGEMQGIPYIDFIVPGLLVMSVITSAYANASFSLFSMKFQRSIEEMMVSPMPNYTLLAGFIFASIVRSLVTAGLVLIVAAFFVDLRLGSLPFTLGVLLLTSTFFAFAGFINGIFANEFDDVNVVPNFILTPLIYLGGVFYSVQLLPEPWQSISLINPIFYLVNIQRYAMLGVADVQVDWALAIICLFTLAAGAICMLLLHRGTGLKE